MCFNNFFLISSDLSYSFFDNNVLYTGDNYSYQYVYWNNIPENYINNLPTTATATISIKNEIGEIISDTQTITFTNKYTCGGIEEA